MWFKNLQVYRFTRPFELTAEQLETQLEACAFTPCGSQDISRFGWTRPFGKLGHTLIHAANVITNPLISAMLSETIEYAELKSGRRCAAIAFSGQTFTGKLAWAIAGGISGTLLIWLGYQPNTAQTQATMDGLFICISLVPILGSIMRIIIMTRYNFTEDKHARVRHALIKWRSNNPI